MMDLIEHREKIQWLLLIEFVFFMMGSVLITNMHPFWCQQLVGLSFWILIITAVIYYFGVTRVHY